MTWKPIKTAPRDGGPAVGSRPAGPVILLRNGERRAKGYWRGGWRDQQAEPLRFEPVEWMEIS